MRLSFANGERGDLLVEDSVTVGSAAGNDLVLAGRDVAAHHARISVGRRGIVLEVLESGAQTHVNARPIREKALLHLGDILCLGRSAILLKADRDDSVQEAPPPSAKDGVAAPVSPAVVVLRGVTGSQAGRAIPVNPRLSIGREASCDVQIEAAQSAPRKVSIEFARGAVVLRGGEDESEVRVNGIAVTAALLHPGDQITLGHSRFLLEAPSLMAPYGDEPLQGEGAAPVAPDAAGAAGENDFQHAAWWLVSAAAVVALILALLIQRGP